MENSTAFMHPGCICVLLRQPASTVGFYYDRCATDHTAYSRVEAMYG
jgi:hypothetical protein